MKIIDFAKLYKILEIFSRNLRRFQLPAISEPYRAGQKKTFIKKWRVHFFDKKSLKMGLTEQESIFKQKNQKLNFSIQTLNKSTLEVTKSRFRFF